MKKSCWLLLESNPERLSCIIEFFILLYGTGGVDYSATTSMKKSKLVTRSFLSVAKTQSRQERNSENRNKNSNASVIITRKDFNREVGGQSNALLGAIKIFDYHTNQIAYGYSALWRYELEPNRKL